MTAKKSLVNFLVLGPPDSAPGFAAALQNAEHPASLALDVFQGAALLASVRPSVMYLVEDLNAGPSGMLAALAAHPACAGVPIVVLTSPIDTGTAAKALTSGAAAVLQMPLGVEEIISKTFALVGDSSEHQARPSALDPRVSSGILRIARYLDNLGSEQAPTRVEVETEAGVATLDLQGGRLVGAKLGSHTGMEAIRAFFALDAGQRWPVRIVAVAPAAGGETANKASAEAVSTAMSEAAPPMATEAQPSAPAAGANTSSSAPPPAPTAIKIDINALSPLPVPTEAQLAALAPPRVVLADDDDALLDLYRTMMSKQGWEIAVGENGEKAWLKILEVRPDVVVSDIMMPELDGWSLLARHRSDFRVGEIPLMLLSCQGDYLSQLGRVVAGAQDYVAKGIRGKKLLQRVRDVMAPRRNFLAALAPGLSFKLGLGSVGPGWILRSLEGVSASGRLVVQSRAGAADLLLKDGEITSARFAHQGALLDSVEQGLMNLIAMRDGVVAFASADPGPASSTIRFTAVADGLAEKLNQRFLDLCGRVAEGKVQLVPTSQELAQVYLEACPDELRAPAQAMLQGQHLTGIDVDLKRRLAEDLLRKGVIREAA